MLLLRVRILTSSPTRIPIWHEVLEKMFTMHHINFIGNNAKQINAFISVLFHNFSSRWSDVHSQGPVTIYFTFLLLHGSSQSPPFPSFKCCCHLLISHTTQLNSAASFLLHVNHCRVWLVNHFLLASYLCSYQSLWIVCPTRDWMNVAHVTDYIIVCNAIKALYVLWCFMCWCATDFMRVQKMLWWRYWGRKESNKEELRRF